MPEPELKLNSLARFSKQSPNLTLEEYSSCEVPAGCGGVVLRWRRPDEPVPMILRTFFFSAKREAVTLDGVDMASQSKIPVSFGQHALTFVLNDVDPDFACLLLVGSLAPEYARILRLQGDTQLLSLPDGTWRYSLDAPEGEDWKLPNFDDSGWKAMVEKPFGALPKAYRGGMSAWTDDLTKQGAKGLSVGAEASLLDRPGALLRKPEPGQTVYIRRTLYVAKGAEEGTP